MPSVSGIRTNWGGMSGAPYTQGCGACTTMTNDNLWTDWNGMYQTQFSSNVWQQWTIAAGTACGSSGIITIPGGMGISGAGPLVPYTPEQMASAEEHARADQAKRAAAKVAARALFEGALSPDQRRELADHRYITVESATSKRRYRIRCDQDRHGNIIELDPAGIEVARLCVAPDGYLPLEDALLGQLLFLKHDEDALRRAANITPLRRSA